MARQYDDDPEDRDDDRYDDDYDDRYDDEEEYDDDYDDYEEEDRRPAPVKKSKHTSPARGRSSRRPPARGKGSSAGRSSRGGDSRRKRAIVIFAVEIVVLLLLLGGAYMLFVRMDVTSVGKTSLTVVTTPSADAGKVELKSNEVVINESVVENQEMKGYRNLALFGVDSRSGQLNKNTLSDTIIICSINQDNGEIRLVSVYRDTYLNLSNDTYNKCNSAYSKGGPAQAISMLNMNLDLDISDFVTVGFSGLRDTIDALGGVQIEVQENEIDHLNNYQISMVGKKNGENAAGEANFVATEGVDYTPVTHAGMQTLNGLQATAFCRIRYVGNDFARAERQRRVLTAALNSAKQSDVATLTKIANNVFKETYTSLDLSEIVNLLGDIAIYHVVGDEGFPVEEFRSTAVIGKKGDCVLPRDLKSNVKWLHGFLFGDTEYEVTPDVERFSAKIDSDIAPYIK